MRFVTLIVLVWLIIGAGTIALTVVAGPLNYFGINPEVTDCNVTVPQPSE